MLKLNFKPIYNNKLCFTFRFGHLVLQWTLFLKTECHVLLSRGNLIYFRRFVPINLQHGCRTCSLQLIKLVTTKLRKSVCFINCWLNFYYCRGLHQKSAVMHFVGTLRKLLKRLSTYKTRPLIRDWYFQCVSLYSWQYCHLFSNSTFLGGFIFCLIS